MKHVHLKPCALRSLPGPFMKWYSPVISQSFLNLFLPVQHLSSECAFFILLQHCSRTLDAVCKFCQPERSEIAFLWTARVNDHTAGMPSAQSSKTFQTREGRGIVCIYVVFTKLSKRYTMFFGRMGLIYLDVLYLWAQNISQVASPNKTVALTQSAVLRKHQEKSLIL